MKLARFKAAEPKWALGNNQVFYLFLHILVSGYAVTRAQTMYE